ncbi:hypothetical protein PC118_g14386, partial [Phytophthora cactorum]
ATDERNPTSSTAPKAYGFWDQPRPISIFQPFCSALSMRGH